MAIVAVGLSEGVFSVVGDGELISAGDPSKAKEKNWVEVPEIMVQEVCAEMVASDLAQAKQNALLKQYVYNVNAGIE